MLNQDVKEEINEYLEGIKATDNFMQVSIDIEKYVAQALELFHSQGQDDKAEIEAYVRQGLKL